MLLLYIKHLNNGDNLICKKKKIDVIYTIQLCSIILVKNSVLFNECNDIFVYYILHFKASLQIFGNFGGFSELLKGLFHYFNFSNLFK